MEQKQPKEDLETKLKEDRNVREREREREGHLEANTTTGWVTALREAHIHSPRTCEHDLRQYADRII